MLFVTCFVLLIHSLIHIVDVVQPEEESDKAESRHNVYKRARRSFSSSSPLFGAIFSALTPSLRAALFVQTF